MNYKPTKADIEIIKAAAAMESVPRVSVGAVLLEPGYRHNTKRPSPESINIALVSDDPEWNDTDLSDYGQWSEFRKGIPLTADGRGIVDFYIRRRGDQYQELHGNITIRIEGGRLVKVHGYGQDAVYYNL